RRLGCGGGGGMKSDRPVVLAIGGSDSCAGAGVQADLRAIEDAGCRACTVITALTAQHPEAVCRIEPAPLAQIEAEMQAVLEYFPVAAVKTGMLVDADRIALISGFLAAMDAGSRPQLVVDPVMQSTSGARLLDDDAGRAALAGALLPLACLFTPNQPEAALWLGRGVESPLADARQIARETGVAVLLKGGHEKQNDGMLRDVLAVPEGEAWIFTHRARSLDRDEAHGTGCRLAAGIAARLALGDSLPDACARALSLQWGKVETEALDA
ncbi:MAG: hydroxymethylpyrimidine/phosphomethylpyrimidine kinase, partial [Mariprofundaceae bacterium]